MAPLVNSFCTSSSTSEWCWWLTSELGVPLWCGLGVNSSWYLWTTCSTQWLPVITCQLRLKKVLQSTFWTFLGRSGSAERACSFGPEGDCFLDWDCGFGCTAVNAGISCCHTVQVCLSPKKVYWVLCILGCWYFQLWEFCHSLLILPTLGSLPIKVILQRNIYDWIKTGPSNLSLPLCCWVGEISHQE